MMGVNIKDKGRRNASEPEAENKQAEVKMLYVSVHRSKDAAQHRHCR
jgi:hypothetical protein